MHLPDFLAEGDTWALACDSTGIVFTWHAQSLRFDPQYHVIWTVAVHTCNLSYPEVEAGGPEVQGHPWPHSEFEIGWGYTKLCLKNKEEKKKRTLKMKGTRGVLDYCWQAGRRRWKVSSVRRTRYFSNIFGHMVSKNFFYFYFFVRIRNLCLLLTRPLWEDSCEFMLGAFGR